MRWRIERSVWAVAFLVAPMAVGVRVPGDTLDAFVDPTSQSGTTFRVAAGGGQYMSFTRDCDGNVITSNTHDFRDVGAEINHRFDNPVELGVKGGYADDGRLFAQPGQTGLFNLRDWEEMGVYYLNPYFATEFDKFGIGIGVIGATGSLNTSLEEEDHIGNQLYGETGTHYYPTGHLRFGRRESTHFSMSILEGLPIYSGGGTFEFGLGTRPAPSVGMWFGPTFGGVYDGAGFLLKLSIDASRAFEIQPNVRWGFSEGSMEYGFGVSLGYRLHH